VWVTAPSASWNAKIKANAAPPRAKVAWYVRPPTLKSNVFVGANVTGKWASKLDVQPPQPRAQLAAMWTIPVGMKVKIAPPDLSAAATARAKVKIGADGQLIRDHRMDVTAPSADIKGKVGAKVAVPDVKGEIKGKVVVPDVKGKLDVQVRDHREAATGAVGAGVKAGADVKAKAGAAVNAGANVKVKVNVPKPPPPPAVKVEGKVKASGGFKIGN
jgi:hypothetical protein